MASNAALAGYALSGAAMLGITYELYTNVTYARGMNVRVRRVEVPAEADLRKIPSDWLTAPNGRIIGTDCWATAPRHALKLKPAAPVPAAAASSSSPSSSSSAASSSNVSPAAAVVDPNEELFLLYANSLLQSPAFGWELFFTNLKRGNYQWTQPWSNLDEGEQIGGYTVSKRTPTSAVLQWAGNAVDGQTQISIHPDQPAALFQLGATLFKADGIEGGSKSYNASESAKNTHMNYLRMVLAQTYTTMEHASKVAHEASAAARAKAAAEIDQAGKPPA